MSAILYGPCRSRSVSNLSCLSRACRIGSGQYDDSSVRFTASFSDSSDMLLTYPPIVSCSFCYPGQMVTSTQSGLLALAQFHFNPTPVSPPFIKGRGIKGEGLPK